MKWILSNYNFDPSWVAEYTTDYLIYDRSDLTKWTNKIPYTQLVFVRNIGSDILDKFSWILENYNCLPERVLLTKSNLFKYISKEEFSLLKDNNEFTPLLTAHHEQKPDFSFYLDNIYWEKNNGWYLHLHPPKHNVQELVELLGIAHLPFVPFAPGSNYIVPRQNILKHPKSFYEKLCSYLTYTRYPGEAMVIERGLYTVWK